MKNYDPRNPEASNEAKVREQEIIVIKELQEIIVRTCEANIAQASDPKIKHRFEKVKAVIEHIITRSPIDVTSQEDVVELTIRQCKVLDTANLILNSPHIEKLVNHLMSVVKAQDLGEKIEAITNAQKELIETYIAMAAGEKDPAIKKANKKLIQVTKRMFSLSLISSTRPKEYHEQLKRDNNFDDLWDKARHEICKTQGPEIGALLDSISAIKTEIELIERISLIRERQRNIVKNFEDCTHRETDPVIKHQFEIIRKSIERIMLKPINLSQLKEFDHDCRHVEIYGYMIEPSRIDIFKKTAKSPTPKTIATDRKLDDLEHKLKVEDKFIKTMLEVLDANIAREPDLRVRFVLEKRKAHLVQGLTSKSMNSIAWRTEEEKLKKEEDEAYEKAYPEYFTKEKNIQDPFNDEMKSRINIFSEKLKLNMERKGSYSTKELKDEYKNIMGDLVKGNQPNNENNDLFEDIKKNQKH